MNRYYNYLLSIGLNDKDTKKQEVKTSKAKDIITKEVLKYVDGATIYNANGIYKGVTEKTIRVEITFFDGDKENDIKSLVNTLKEKLNQECIAVSKSKIASDLW